MANIYHFMLIVLVMVPLMAMGEEFTLENVPSLSQRSGMNSELFCGPAAVVNTLEWLKRSKRADVLRGMKNEDQLVSFANRLGSSKYMKTDNKDGTSVEGMAFGLSKYLDECAVPHQIESRPWALAPAPTQVATFQWICEALKAQKCVVITIGWYTKFDQGKVYSRNGGHFITGVGYKIDDKKRELIFNDPLKTNTYIHSEIAFVDQDWGVQDMRASAETKEMPMILKGVNSALGNVAIVEYVMSYMVK